MRLHLTLERQLLGLQRVCDSLELKWRRNSCTAHVDSWTRQNCVPRIAADTGFCNNCVGACGAQVFSFFEYSSKCSKRTLRLPMEPLVGMMRHPFVIPICRPEVRLTSHALTLLLGHCRSFRSRS